MLTKEQIQKYQEIYKLTFGEEVSEIEALNQGEALIELMKQIYKPIKIKK